VKALETAWAAVLADPLLHGDTGISVALFGAVGTPLVKQHHGSLSKVLGMQLRKWCVLQAQSSGLKPLDVPGQPSSIRVR
jgi:ERCC4-related helicase